MTNMENGNGPVKIIEVLTHVIDELKQLSAAIKADGVDLPAPMVPKQANPEFAEVRALLAEISRSGRTAEVKRLLKSHGCEKLSEINPDEYAALMDEARALS